jgi:hypothetical protein
MSNMAHETASINGGEASVISTILVPGGLSATSEPALIIPALTLKYGHHDNSCHVALQKVKNLWLVFRGSGSMCEGGDFAS